MKELRKPIVEMANLLQNRTGLSDKNFVVYISTKEGIKPRVRLHKIDKLGSKSPYASYSIEDNPKLLNSPSLFIPQNIENELKVWIKKNKPTLLKLWNSDPDGLIILDFLDELDKV